MSTTITSINEAAVRLLQIKEKIKEMEVEKKALTDFLKAVMNLNQEDTLSGDGWEANRQSFTVTRLDSRAFQADNPALYTQYTKTVPQTRFVIVAKAMTT